ncbi:homeobox-DDT domain protein RLT3-like [Syzygium oleosum]|uniref:homeobox-DDT domain protein RLT3-like n=1 Tax=Syzygium oleosum TaxID=219896 RepID=UPI0011D2A954|nr:homeobox-DDT domain protein RLT3-like [Syzygium oleosum]XP_056171320.1 homeobox-DDT domain protein RLT3-like [Syzygium oleosum]
MELKRKTPLQLQSLEKFYSEDEYPTQKAMKGYAASLGLTFKQVQGWFMEKRKRRKRNGEVPFSISAQDSAQSAESLPSTCGHLASTNAKRREKPICLQDMLFSPDYILKKVFRKDGPVLGVEFDSLPTGAFLHGSQNKLSCEQIHREPNQKKVSNGEIIDGQDGFNSGPVKRHGIGKGLMTTWRATNPDGGHFPTGVDIDRGAGAISHLSTSKLKKKTCQSKIKRQQTLAMIQRKLKEKSSIKKKPLMRKKEKLLNQNSIPKGTRKEKCDLALEGGITQELLDKFTMLVDDEEMEMRELQAGPKPLCCSDHFASNGSHGCSLCKDVLAKFPPISVKMKQPFCMQPWDSLEMVKKLFKAIHFLYTFAAMLDINSFTLDEFAQAFHDKDSLLLGKIHVALLKLLLFDVETELTRGSFHHLSKSCKLLALLHSVESQDIIVDFWKKSLNPLTWPEILRQVLVAAGFGSKKGASHREAVSEEMSLMMKYGMRPGTLKGELFRLLSEQGNNGLKVSEMARASQVMGLNISSNREELENAISSMLSSDITLFEKISSSTYRLRINFASKDAEHLQSDTDDSGSVENLDDDTCSSGDDTECDSGDLTVRKFKRANSHKSKNSMVIVDTEIDESHPGEVWLLGLMEGEYSDLSIEEKLNALVALIDLVRAGSTILMEPEQNSSQVCTETVPSSIYTGSGAKIKRTSSNQQNLLGSSWVHHEQRHGLNSSAEIQPIDSSALLSKSHVKQISSGKSTEAKDVEIVDYPHAMQSVYLGSDRRYNRYWLFLGPCNSCDPGHRSVYFESSEDGHWEIIDTKEAFCSLLSVLDDRGAREALLIESLEKRKAFIFQAMSSCMVSQADGRSWILSDMTELDSVREESSSPISDVDNGTSLITSGDSFPSSGAITIEVGTKGEELKQSWSRLKAFDSWMWNFFYLALNAVRHRRKSYHDSLNRCERCHDLYWRDEKHCKICHTTFELDFDLEERYAIHAATCREKEETDTFPKHRVLSSQLQSLKAAIHAIESAMPKDALIGAWTKSAHRLWVKRLRRTSSLAELLQVLADFVSAINRDWLRRCDTVPGYNLSGEEIVAYFPTLPHTTSAVALWLVKMDMLVAPYLETLRSNKNH